MRTSTKCILLALAGVLACDTSALAHSYSIDSDALFKSFCSSFRELTLGEAARSTAQDRARYTTADQCPYEGIPYLISEDSAELIDTRRCWVATDSEPLGLGLLFANGWGGVEVDYDASLHYLCRVDLDKAEIAPFELWIMAEYVDDDMRNADAPKPLKYCDHITSGRGGLTCESIEADAHDKDQQRRFDVVESALAAAVRDQLKALKAAADAFADKESDMREYESRLGTAHAAMALEVETALKDQFIATLERMAGARAPALSEKESRRIDAALNASYKKLLATPEACPECGGTHDLPEVRRDAQRAWLRYRDAFAAFYAARWKQAAPAATLRRECIAALVMERSAAMDKLASSE